MSVERKLAKDKLVAFEVKISKAEDAIEELRKELAKYTEDSKVVIKYPKRISRKAAESIKKELQKGISFSLLSAKYGVSVPTIRKALKVLEEDTRQEV